jgi:biopolymer transport protein ExbB
MSLDFSWFSTIENSPVFLVLLACSVVTLALSIERFIYFLKRKGNPGAILDALLKKVRAGDLKRAQWICEDASHPLGAVASQIFESESPHGEPLEERIGVSLREQKLLLERNLGLLGTMAAISPLVGLLGTIWGIMRAFQDMALAGSAAPSVVAAGVAEALLTTAAGIVVAVPAIILYNHFSRRANVILTMAENGARKVRALMMENGWNGDYPDERNTVRGSMDHSQSPAGTGTESPELVGVT